MASTSIRIRGNQLYVMWRIQLEKIENLLLILLKGYLAYFGVHSVEEDKYEVPHFASRQRLNQ